MLAIIFDSVSLTWRRVITLAFYSVAALAAGSAFFADSPLDGFTTLWAAVALAAAAMFLHINLRTGILAESVAPRASMICMVVFLLGVLGLIVSAVRFDGMSL